MLPLCKTKLTFKNDAYIMYYSKFVLTLFHCSMFVSTHKHDRIYIPITYVGMHVEV